MNDPRQDTVEEALRSMAADRSPGQHVVGWVAIVATTSTDAESNEYMSVIPPGQPAHVTAGLLVLGKHMVTSAGHDH